jgi:tRNA(adenine34) deaminase
MPTHTTGAGKSARRTAKKGEGVATHRWSAKVTTDSTHPQKGLFLKSPATIAHQLATKAVSPKGPSSGMRMLTFYINRAGENLGKHRLADLQKAKKILSEIIASHTMETNSKAESKKKAPTKNSTRKNAA